MIDACGADLVVFAQHGGRSWAGSRRDRRRAAFGVAIALRDFGLLSVAVALARLAAVYAPDPSGTAKTAWALDETAQTLGAPARCTRAGRR